MCVSVMSSVGMYGWLSACIAEEQREKQGPLLLEKGHLTGSRREWEVQGVEHAGPRCDSNTLTNPSMPAIRQRASRERSNAVRRGRHTLNRVNSRISCSWISHCSSFTCTVPPTNQPTHPHKAPACSHSIHSAETSHTVHHISMQKNKINFSCKAPFDLVNLLVFGIQIKKVQHISFWDKKCKI